MATVTKVKTLSGTLTRCDVRDEAENDWNYTHRYSPNSEHRTKYLDCELRTDNGHTVYFKTPRSCYRVTSCPGAAVVSFKESLWDEAAQAYVFPADHPWFRVQGDVSVATPGRPADRTIVPTLAVGDRVTITGRIKTEATSKRGNPYTVLNHVKRVE